MNRSLIVIMILSALVVALPAGNCRAENLIPNGGFEQTGADGGPEKWQFNTARDTEAEIVLDNTMAHSGSNSYRIDIAPPGGRVMIYPEEGAIKKPKPGQTYLLSLWVNAKNLDYNQFFVAPAVRFNFQPTRVRPVPTIDLMAYMKGASGWKELTLKATAPADAKALNLDIILTKGTVWIDDISLTPVEE